MQNIYTKMEKTNFFLYFIYLINNKSRMNIKRTENNQAVEQFLIKLKQNIKINYTRTKMNE